MKSKQTCEGCQGKGFLDKSDGYDYGEVVCPICVNVVDSKQSTLEEYIEKYSAGIIEPHIRTLHKMCFKDGVEWQAKRMYSEEDLREAFKQSRLCKIFEKDMPPVYETFEEWLKQFKKK
jgi:hypothetical protein